jgi:hypothetical protein
MWMVGYYFIMFVWYKKRLQENNYPTLFTYLLGEGGAWEAAGMYLGDIGP